MPYTLVKNKDGTWSVVSKDTGKNHGKTTKPKAEAQLRLLEEKLHEGGK